MLSIFHSKSTPVVRKFYMATKTSKKALNKSAQQVSTGKLRKAKGKITVKYLNLVHIFAHLGEQKTARLTEVVVN